MTVLAETTSPRSSPQRLAQLLAMALSVTLICACSEEETFDAPDRTAGARVPLSGSCDDLDPTRCHLPWPSTRFLVVDDATATGLRQRLEPGTYSADDDAAVLELADGFSRISPIIVGTKSILGPLDDAVVRVWVAEPGHPSYGEQIPVRVEVQTDEALGESFVVAYPRRPMPENAAHVVVVMSSAGLEPAPATLAALALREPASQAEADLRGYHAPTRSFLTEVGVDPARVARAWDFVTRSQAQVVDPLLAMRDATLGAVNDGITFAIDKVELSPKPGTAMIVEGTVELPWFVTDSLPDLTQKESHVAHFRVVVPEGTGDYPVVLFGHGLGGGYDDPAFDEALAAEGLGKLGVDFHGWTIDSFFSTLGGFIRPFAGSARASGLMMQALAEMSALQRALDGSLADVLAADMIGGVPNPAAGRRPDMTTPMYGGGSLGGTVGFIYANMEPTIRYGALNVGGGGWSHFLRSSIFFAPLDALMRIDLGSPLDVTLAVAQAQTNLDHIDGAVWADQRDDPPVLLMQESIGDVVLPNIGCELMALSSGAVRVGEAIEAFGDLKQVSIASEQTAITQYLVTGDDAGVHGFAITDTPAGNAARDQIRHFFSTAQQGKSEVIVPAQCAAALCDFAD
jgi:hypothetical protein